MKPLLALGRVIFNHTPLQHSGNYIFILNCKIKIMFNYVTPVESRALNYRSKRLLWPNSVDFPCFRLCKKENLFLRPRTWNISVFIRLSIVLRWFIWKRGLLVEFLVFWYYIICFHRSVIAIFPCERFTKMFTTYRLTLIGTANIPETKFIETIFWKKLTYKNIHLTPITYDF